MSFECEVIVKLDPAISLINLSEFDFLFLKFACVRIFFHANCSGRYCFDLVLKFSEKSVELFMHVLI